MLKKYKVKIVKYVEDVLREEHSEHAIALSFAIGTFITIMPAPWLHALLLLLVALIYKKANKLALFSTLVVWNPFVLAPLYLAAYNIGSSFSHLFPPVPFEHPILIEIYDISTKFLSGILLLSLAIAFLSYFVVRYFVRLSRSQKEKQVLKKSKAAKHKKKQKKHDANKGMKK